VSWLNSYDLTPNGDAEYWGAVKKLGDFGQVSQCISETVRGMAIVAIEVK